MKNNISFLAFIILLMSVSSDLQRKYIRSGDYDIVCYVSLKKTGNYNEGREYYWFKTGEIHNSVSSAGGLVLHDKYEKFYRSKQLAERGIFDYGLKDGEWRTWYENGYLESICKWNNGQKNGVFLSYGEDGTLVLSGNYKKDEKIKTWINHKLKDTVFYKGDSIYGVKPKSILNGLFNRIFKKKDSTEKAQAKLERQMKRSADSIKRAIRKQKRQEAQEIKDSSKKKE